MPYALLGAILLCGLLGACGDSKHNPSGPVNAWLLAVASLPQAGSDSVPDDTLSYTVALNIPADTNTTSKIAALPQALTVERPLPLAKAWEARLAYEARRREAARAPIEGERPLPWFTGLQVPALTGCTLSSSCGTGQMCWHGQCTATLNPNFIDGTPMNCNVVSVVTTGQGTQINVVADTNAANLSDPNVVAAMTNAVTAFGGTFDSELQILGQAGHTFPVDRDRDGRFTIVFTNFANFPNAGLAADANDLAGFFAIADFLAPTGAQGGINPDGNQADIMWVKVPNPQNPQPQLVAGTVAHEYVHMTSYALRVYGPAFNGTTALGQEDVWLDEGMAHLMEDLTGWGSSTVDVLLVALQYWTQKGALASGTDTLYQRGQAYTLLRYLVDQQAKQHGAANANSTQAAQAANTVVGTLLRENKLGWQHAIFQELGATGVGHWLQAVYATGLPSANLTTVHAYDYLPVGASPITHVPMGFNPYGTSYTDTEGAAVSLPGPATTPLDATSPDLDEAFLNSSSAFYPTSGFDASHAQLTSPADPTAGPFLYIIPVGAAAN